MSFDKFFLYYNKLTYHIFFSFVIRFVSNFYGCNSFLSSLSILLLSRRKHVLLCKYIQCWSLELECWKGNNFFKLSHNSITSILMILCCISSLLFLFHRVGCLVTLQLSNLDSEITILLTPEALQVSLEVLVYSWYWQ